MLACVLPVTRSESYARYSYARSTALIENIPARLFGDDVLRSIM